MRKSQRKFLKYIELNENTTHQNLWYTVKALNIYIRKEKINSLSSYLKKLEKAEENKQA